MRLMNDTPTSEYIRLFFETGGCDEVCDLTLERGEYTTRLGERLARVLRYDDSHKDMDERETKLAVLRYARPHERQLVRCLPLWQRVQRYTIGRTELPGMVVASSHWLKDRVAVEEAVNAAIVQRVADGRLTVPRAAGSSSMS